MSYTPHTLGEEFPDQMDRIHTLKVSDSGFAQLLVEYDGVNDANHLAEINIQPAAHDHETALRKRRLAIKDRISEALAQDA